MIWCPHNFVQIYLLDCSDVVNMGAELSCLSCLTDAWWQLTTVIPGNSTFLMTKYRKSDLSSSHLIRAACRSQHNVIAFTSIFFHDHIRLTVSAPASPWCLNILSIIHHHTSHIQIRPDGCFLKRGRSQTIALLVFVEGFECLGLHGSMDVPLDHGHSQQWSCWLSQPISTMSIC